MEGGREGGKEGGCTDRDRWRVEGRWEVRRERKERSEGSRKV